MPFSGPTLATNKLPIFHRELVVFSWTNLCVQITVLSGLLHQTHHAQQLTIA